MKARLTVPSSTKAKVYSLQLDVYNPKIGALLNNGSTQELM